MRNQIKNLKVDKVDKVKKEIKVIKRAGGTLRFARALKKIRVAKKEKVQKRLHRVLSLQQKVRFYIYEKLVYVKDINLYFHIHLFTSYLLSTYFLCAYP